MESQAQDLQLEDWQSFVGAWATEATYPMLPGAEIRGETTFEWLEAHRFLIQRSHYDHPEIPDAIALIGVTDEHRHERPRRATPTCNDLRRTGGPPVAA